MSKLPEEHKIYDLISVIEEKMEINTYLSPTPLKLKSRVGNEYYGYYLFYSDKAFRLEYLNQELVGCSFWDEPGSLLDASMRIDLSAIDESQAQGLLLKFLSSIPDKEDIESDITEVKAFIDHMGPFIKAKGASYAYDSYDSWAELNSENRLDKNDFYVAFNKAINQESEDMTSRIETAIMGEQIVVSEIDSDDFKKKVLKNSDYQSSLLLEAGVRCMANNDAEINAMFVCGNLVSEAREEIRSVLQDEGVWASKVLWKEKVSSIYQFLSILWKYRSNYILVFNNVEAPVKNKDHNFDMLLDEVMKTESPNRIVSYTRKEKDVGK